MEAPATGFVRPVKKLGRRLQATGGQGQASGRAGDARRYSGRRALHGSSRSPTTAIPLYLLARTASAGGGGGQVNANGPGVRVKRRSEGLLVNVLSYAGNAINRLAHAETRKWGEVTVHQSAAEKRPSSSAPTFGGGLPGKHHAAFGAARWNSPITMTTIRAAESAPCSGPTKVRTDELPPPSSRDREDVAVYYRAQTTRGRTTAGGARIYEHHLNRSSLK